MRAIRARWIGAFLVAAAAPTAAEEPLHGFRATAATVQRDLERRFDAHLDAGAVGGWIGRFAARPHPLGSPAARENAAAIAALLDSWGFAVAIEEFQVLFPTPTERRLELLAPHRFVAGLAEPPVAGDAAAGQTAQQLPVYNAYSIDGDVTGELVYVNYGVPADYEELSKRGIDVAGRIVIARYGGSWRGIKPKVAAEHGAIGCILYSDPRDDGYFQGDPYPAGGFRPPRGAQRGSVADMPLYPGDPLTPGTGATAAAARLPREQAPTLTRIPVLPISWADAQPLLAALAGPVAPEAWRGGLPLTYHLGPGPARVRLALAFDWRLVPAYDVIARLPGAVFPDRWIVRGNHHDAWVNGATDPVSGLAALLAEARAVGELARTGWRPKRTLVYAAWDGEEPGLLGSVEWVEHHAAELTDKAVAYINSDSNARGILSAGGSHALEPFLNGVAREVTDPETGLPLAARMRAQLELAATPEEREKAEKGGDLPLDPLGSGSDYTPFLQHLGIATLNVGFAGEGDYGQYHSAYDTFDHYRRFMDPGFRYGVALARVGGRLALRLAEADTLPFRFTPLATTVALYVAEVEKLLDRMREETALETRRREQGTYRAAWDPEDRWREPPAREPVPHLNFAPLRNAAAALTASAARLDPALAALDAAPEPLDPERAARLDRELYGLERSLTRTAGLPRRPWFVHQIYAPGFYTGYGVKTLPGVREGIEQRQWREAEEQAAAVAETLAAAAAALDRARQILP